MRQPLSFLLALLSLATGQYETYLVDGKRARPPPPSPAPPAAHLPPPPAQLVFAALGGSNTVGAKSLDGKIKGHHSSFARYAFSRLQAAGNVTEFANGGIGAMGPDLAASCSAKFVPRGSRFATIEYLPNIGYTNDDDGELAAVEKLMQRMSELGVRGALVDILPGGEMKRFANCTDHSIGCTSRRHIEELHQRLVALAARYGMPSISMDYDDEKTRPFFGADMMHLTQEGHDLVGAKLMNYYSTWPHVRLTRARL